MRNFFKPSENLVLLSSFILFIAASFLATFTPLGNYDILCIVVGQVAVVIPPAIYMILRGHHKVGDEWFTMPSAKNIKMAVLVIICAYPVVEVLANISLMFVDNMIQESVDSTLGLGLGVGLAVIAVMPAFNEELLCRGALYLNFRKRSRVFAVILSALLFALLHLNLNQISYSLFLGLIFAMMVEATGSIFTSMIMHFLFNGFNAVLGFIALSIPEEATEVAASAEMEIVSPIILFVSYFLILVVFIILCIVFIYRTFRMNGRHFLSRTEGLDEKPRRPLIDFWLILYLLGTGFFIWANTVFA